MSHRNVAIILAAGLGTRMKSPLPKVMHQVLGRPMIGHVVQTALDLGCDEIAVVVGYKKEQVQEYLTTAFPNAPITFHVQEEMNGTGDAVRSAHASYASGDPQVTILSGDVPNTPSTLLQQALALQANHATPAVVLTAIAPPHTAYGRIVRNHDGRLERIVEYKDADQATRDIREINSGIYVFSGAFLREHIHTLTTDNTQGEFYLTDLLEIAAQHQTPAHALLAPDISILDGVNTRVHLAAANAVARRLRNQTLMESGVTLIDPETTWIDVECALQTDIVIEPHVILRGHCIIEEGAYIEGGVRLENVHVRAHQRIQQSSHERRRDS